MRLFNFRACVLSSTTLVLLSFSQPAAAADSYCPGCGAAIVGVGIGVGVGVGLAIYFIHHGHTSLKGCVQQTDKGLTLTAKDGNIYSLVNAPNEAELVNVCPCGAIKSNHLPGVLFGWTTSP